MISTPLLKRSLWSGFKLMIPFIAILAMYSVMIIWMYDPELSKSLDQFQDIMPDLMAAVGMTGSTGTLIEFIHTYLYGFIMLFIPIIYVIMLANKFIMRYVDNGSIACILATANSRKRVIFTQMLSVTILVVVLIGISTAIGCVSSAVMFPGDLDVTRYLKLNGAVVLFDLAISGICVFAACFFNESRWYLALGGGLPLVFYVIQMMANMGDKLEKSEVCDDLYSDARPGYFSRHGKCGALLHHDGSDLADILCGGRPDLHKKDLSV